MQNACASGSVHTALDQSAYIPPAEEAVQKKLAWFQDQKLALFVHFGVYSQLGMCESWPLSDGDADWARAHYLWEREPNAFRQSYFSLNRSFNPIRFDPAEWAAQAEAAGMKYLIFTTKHHDGFCLYDTRQTEYRVTAADCPFHANANANIAKALFHAFRARGLGIAAYFSKPDWHCPWYWAPGQEKPVGYDRNPTYDPLDNPALWDAFTRFSHAQMRELAFDLGPLDILWLDGGQVRPDNRQDLRMARIASELRARTPGLIIADRTVGGAFENYITPEQAIPPRPILVPWESCLTVGRGFAYSFDDEYKSPRALCRMLLEVVCKGGNLALGVGAQPDGRLPRAAMQSAKILGDWLRACGEAVYATRAQAPYLSGAWVGESGPSAGYTRGENACYALFPLAEGEIPPETLIFPWPGPLARISFLPGGESALFAREGDAVRVRVPRAARENPPLALAARLEA